MTNKITQLVNESGDNLYPLAGGMAADSINTQMLKDGAVTSDKIDWTTFHEVGFGTLNSTYFSSGTCFWERFGKMIVVTIYDANITTAPPNNGWTAKAISNLPKRCSDNGTGAIKIFIPNRGNGASSTVVRIAMGYDATDAYFHYTTSTGDDFSGQFIYFTD